MTKKMEAKKLLVSLFALASLLLLVSTVSAAEIAPHAATIVEVNDIPLFSTGASNAEFGITAGETLDIEVTFISLLDASDVKVRAEIDGYNVDVRDETARFDVENGTIYRKTLSLTVPSDLKDELSDNAQLQIKIFNKDHETELPDVDLKVQRESYKVEIKSIGTSQTAKAGENLAVDVVLKNVGYNDADDLFVVVSVPALGVERSGYFGDLVALEENSDDDDDVDTVSGRIYLQLPEDAKSGTYALQVEVTSDDLEESATRQITVKNEFAGNNVIATVTGKTVAVGENAEYSILIVNPTNKVKVYTIVPQASGDLSVTTEQTVVAVPAGSSQTVKVTAMSNEEGTYNFNVNVLSAEEVVGSVALTTTVEGKALQSPVIVLTVVLAVIFIVLLIVLIVLLGRKPEKSEEFGESYY